MPAINYPVLMESEQLKHASVQQGGLQKAFASCVRIFPRPRQRQHSGGGRWRRGAGSDEEAEGHGLLGVDAAAERHATASIPSLLQKK